MSRRNLEKTQPRPLKADAMFSRKCRRTRYTTPVDARIALGRLPGWIAHWREMSADPSTKIGRPRQIYTGYTERDYPNH